MHDTPEFAYVDTSENLARLLDGLAEAPRIAVDTEADSLHHYFEKVCLIQLSTDRLHAVVDPLAELDFDPFLAVLASRTLVFHGLDYDLRMLAASFDFRPETPVEDTMIAAQLLGRRRLGLTALVEEEFGVSLGKGPQRSDWSQRPLTDRQLEYAINDTCWLLSLRDRLVDELERLGRLPWFRQSCEAAVAATAEVREADPETQWRIKGASRLSRRELAYLRPLWYWRDAEARRIDRPAFYVINNNELRELAVAAAETSPEDAVQAVRLPRNCRGRRLQSLKGVLREARSLPADDWPVRHLQRGSAPPPEVKKLANKLRAAGRRAAGELDLDPPVLASRATLERLAARRPASRPELGEVPGILPWQAEVLWPHVESLLTRS